MRAAVLSNPRPAGPCHARAAELSVRGKQASGAVLAGSGRKAGREGVRVPALLTPRADADVGSAEPDWLVDVEDVLSCLETLASKQEELQGQAQELTALLHSAAYALAARTALRGEPVEAGRDRTALDLFLSMSATKLLDECTEQHPGALCCTHAAVRRGADGRSAEVVVRTRASLTGVAPGLGLESLVALASQSLARAGARLSERQARDMQAACLPASLLRAHDDLRRVLREGEVVRAERNEPTGPYSHPSYTVHVQDPSSPRVVRAIFKPRIPGDSDGWHRVPTEWVAYELALMLGLDLVPPAALRRDVRIDGESVGDGALLYFAHKSRVLHTVPESEWGVRKDVLLSDARILDVLLQNSDRHHGHFLFGEHWARGRWEGSRWRGDLSAVLIDHAAGFRREAVVLMQHENAFSTGPVQVVSAQTYLRLRFLDERAMSRFDGVLSEQEQRGVLQRRDQVLAYLDRLVAERGYHDVVV